MVLIFSRQGNVLCMVNIDGRMSYIGTEGFQNSGRDLALGLNSYYFMVGLDK